MNNRIFVEKKEIFDVESAKVLKQIQELYPDLQKVKVYNIYDVFDLENQFLEVVIKSTFADPVTDIVHQENPVQHSFFAMEFLPGQFDQRADSAEQCIALLTGNTEAKVRSGTLIFIENASEAQLAAVQDILINKVESQVKNLELLEIPKENHPKPVVTYDGFNEYNTERLNQFYLEHGFSFGLDDLEFIQNYFKIENRNPTETELKVLDTYWSDHCRHTTFETALTDIQFEGKFKETLETIFQDYLEKRTFLGRTEKPISLMDLATVAAKYFHKTGKLDNLVISDEINACTIEIEAEFDGKKEPYYLLFKNETHNHPIFC